MADDVTIDNGALADFTISTDDVAGKQIQRVKLVDGTDGSAAEIQGTAANGLEVDVTRIATGAKIQITDGTSDATVRNLAANDALNVAIVDGSGNQVTSFAGSGGTSSTDDADFTAGSTAGTPIMGAFTSSITPVTDTDMGVVGITTNRELNVNVSASSIDVAHDLADTGNPVKVGAKAASALPTAVTTGDRANNISDLFGRLLVAHIDPGMQTWKSANITSTQTGGIIWDPAAGKRIAITYLAIGSYGTTAARLILWFGATADSTYTAGTDQLVFAASFAPSSTVKPGAIIAPPSPIYSVTADHELKVTTDAAMSCDITMYGYEF